MSVELLCRSIVVSQDGIRRCIVAPFLVGYSSHAVGSGHQPPPCLPNQQLPRSVLGGTPGEPACLVPPAPSCAWLGFAASECLCWQPQLWGRAVAASRRWSLLTRWHLPDAYHSKAASYVKVRPAPATRVEMAADGLLGCLNLRACFVRNTRGLGGGPQVAPEERADPRGPE